MQLRLDLKQVVSIFDKCGEILVVCQVQAASKTGQQHPEAEDVGERVVVTNFVFPTPIGGKKTGTFDGATAGDQQILLRALAIGNIEGAAARSNDFDGLFLLCAEHSMNFTPCQARFGSGGIVEPQFVAFDLQGLMTVQRCDLTEPVCVNDLAQERQ